jgi:hypothetical protein
VPAKVLPDGLLDRIARRSPRAAAYVDWCDHSNMWSSGGPMNGQVVRRRIVSDLARHLQPEAVVETGTYRGESTAFLADVTGAPTFTCEVLPRYHEYVIRRFRRRADISIERADSRTFLRRLAERSDVPAQNVLFYLDAHWYDDLPLREELELIGRHWVSSAIVIDDFEVPGDPGYGFDDYGPGRCLTAAILPEEVMAGRTALYPSAPSTEETGARRGCVIIVDEAVAADVVRHVPLTVR